MRKQPERTLRTRNKIIDAFWELYREKAIEKISINSIMQATGMNRGTFYEYFTDIYELLDTVEEELLNDMMAQIKKYILLEMKEQEKEFDEIDLNDFTQILVKVLLMYGDKMYVLLCQKGGISFQNKFKEKLRVYLNPMIPSGETEENVEYMLTFMVSAISGVTSQRYEMHGQTDFTEFISLLMTLVRTGIFGYLERES